LFIFTGLRYDVNVLAVCTLTDIGESGGKMFFKLFTESTFEGSRAAAQKMKKFA
jgi:hypothetical protein